MPEATPTLLELAVQARERGLTLRSEHRDPDGDATARSWVYALRRDDPAAVLVGEHHTLADVAADLHGWPLAAATP